MNEAIVLRILRKAIRPARMRSGMVIFDATDPCKWSARVETDGRDRWFKGLGKRITEMVTWTPDEDPEKQVCLP